MNLNAARAGAVLSLLLAGFAVVQAQMQDYRVSNLDLLQLLNDKSWAMQGQHSRSPSIHFDLDNPEAEIPLDDEKIYPDDDDLRLEEKRSGLATALNYGRRRREPSQSLEKVFTYRNGLLNNMGSFFDTMRGSLRGITNEPPAPEPIDFQDTPDDDEPPSTGGGGLSSGIRNIHTLRPIRPINNIRSYNRRSFVKTDGGYPGANHHNPKLLWTNLGR